MKVKLLKKIRKRFTWYKNNAGTYVLADKLMKSVTFINEFHYKQLTTESTNIVGIDEYLYRLLKDKLLKPFGFSYNEIMFRQSLKMAEKKKQEKL